jgi:hypothetical protein
VRGSEGIYPVQLHLAVVEGSPTRAKERFPTEERPPAIGALVFACRILDTIHDLPEGSLHLENRTRF